MKGINSQPTNQTQVQWCVSLVIAGIGLDM